ncbi:MAG TPA: HAMP domain-containing sensor histidine kinase [Anaerohalosphaeraceae bacterium]|jgi:signal transduction histidine kinase|nr:HAMP domain-containing sensor histidine kinase [Anaerohalosphaeraceae bacterium]HRT51861.1 HAMP domain-containing sensor histidine kinase [Anaerohalosphaeraceae bacterium]HRT87899.1 HAMP domain-containing sensor histidine kinase [Anaerohalosphaeraceae bacterium]
MEQLPRDARLAKRADWLIRIRWIAIAGVVIATFVAYRLMHIAVGEKALYAVAAVLAGYNAAFLVLLRRGVGCEEERCLKAVHRIVMIQISLDLVMLTILLHFSGGIENPFVVFFVFHMVIASILLPARESYLQATLAALLLVVLVLLEGRGLIPHYCLGQESAEDVHYTGWFVAVRVGVLAATLYIVVYLASSIATQLRRQEEVCWLANSQLQEKDKIKDEYVARVTHDIKGHLAAVQSCLEIVQNGTLGPLNERQSEFVGRAMTRTETLITFVRALLRLTQIRLANQYEVGEYSLRQIIANAMATAESRAESKNIRLTTSLDHTTDTLVGNSTAIEEMVANLLLNAIKYTPENGSVAVRALDTDGGVQIKIEDTGIGIPAAELPHVFDEFFRAANARKVERDGTGLGLSIARQIVKRHGGKIRVDSTEGKGTTFYVTLPRPQAQA